MALHLVQIHLVQPQVRLNVKVRRALLKTIGLILEDFAEGVHSSGKMLKAMNQAIFLRDRRRDLSFKWRHIRRSITKRTLIARGDIACLTKCVTKAWGSL